MLIKIYAIQNTLTGEKFLGQTSKNLNACLKKHKLNIKKCYKPSNELYMNMKLYGINNFKVLELEKHFARDRAFIRNRINELALDMQCKGQSVGFV